MEEKNLIELLEQGESAELECKAAKGGLPKDVWETYSAFANTDGGIILLGVKQEGYEFSPIEIDAPKVAKEFWDGINNVQRISENILTNRNVQLVTLNGKQVVYIYVPRASRNQRPIYIGHNPMVGTYRRNYEGDYKCPPDEVKRMLADQQDSQDYRVLLNFGINDLNLESVKSYRRRFASLKPDHPWNDLELNDFLYRIGAWGRNRETNQDGLTLAGLVMFGEERSIVDLLPQYFLEYREITSEITGQRWNDRITSADGTWSGNIYDFYFKVIHRLTSDLNIPFQLNEGLFRTDDTRVHAALREALVNTLAHADYYGDRGIVIEKEKTFFRFSNPGTLRISIEQARQGGISDPRNANVFKMFMQLGLGERAGSGIENIHLAWKEQHWKHPDLVEEYQPERIILTLTTQSLLPNESIQFLQTVLKSVYDELTNDEVLALVTAHQEEKVTNQRLQTLMDKHSPDINKVLSGLVEKQLLQTSGQGRGTKYELSEKFYKQASSINFGGNTKDPGGNEYDLGGNIEDPGGNDHDIRDNSNENEETSQGKKENADEKLLAVAEEARRKKRLNKKAMEQIILELCSIQPLALKELASLLNRSVDTLRKEYMNRLVESGTLELLYPESVSHPQQAYKTSKCDM
ncbi:RNA-binding domain-containing protein [Bacillus sp. 123MFChir2]|uniref:RNA-binding domain-containing protein n=1 Tax=Bacillus sp. 123MFChir2 TaxID=1169144 RepID=UPI000370BEFD|nr:RNA-binding domain-containing protein [Bacillus sp. 123MFChir2]